MLSETDMCEYALLQPGGGSRVGPDWGGLQRHPKMSHAQCGTGGHGTQTGAAHSIINLFHRPFLKVTPHFILPHVTIDLLNFVTLPGCYEHVFICIVRPTL